MPCEVKGGLDTFSFLDEINGWTIERKIDSKTKEVYCRASLRSDGSWFSARTRLDKNDELITSANHLNSEYVSKLSIKEVKVRLEKCRSSVIYIQ